MKHKAVTKLPLDQEQDPGPYEILEKMRGNYPDIDKARIKLVWGKGWSEDQDGNPKLGECVKLPELYMRMTGADFVILLPYELWTGLEKASAEKARALREMIMDHHLAHCMPVIDSLTGHQKEDEARTLLWRRRAHDVEEFVDVARRHGPLLPRLRELREALRNQETNQILLDLRGHYESKEDNVVDFRSSGDESQGHGDDEAERDAAA